MLPICQVCLSTDRNLQVIDVTLDDFYDELCDFEACQMQSVTQFCSECAYMLRKFNDFKEKCRLAVKILKSWRNQKSAVRQALSLLSAQMPPSHLGFANKQNFKVYYFQADELDSVLEPLDVNNCIVPVITSLGHNVETIKLQPFDYNIIQNNCIVESDIKIEQEQDNSEDDDTETLVFEDYIKCNDSAENIIKTCGNDVNSGENNKFSGNKVNFGGNQANVNEVNISGNEVNKNNVNKPDLHIKHLIDETTIKTESESSDDEVLILKREKKSIDSLAKTLKTNSVKKDKNKRRRKVPVQLTTLKQRLVTRFADNEELKNDEGTTIDKELILNSLDKMPQRKLQQLWNITGSKTVSPEAIKLLSHMQKKYSDQYSSIFVTEHLPSRALVEAEFRKRREDASYVAADYKCELCYRGFKYQKMLEFHVRVQHDESRPHACAVCRMRFNSASSLSWHSNTHSAVYKCKRCPLVTNYRKTMLDHYHYHNGDLYNCQLCQAVFRSRSGLCLHKIRAHPTRHACAVCARTFASELGLTAHTRLKHQNEESSDNAASKPCEHCDAAFSCDKAYQRHLVQAHGHTESELQQKKRAKYTPNFVCPVCKVVEHSYGAMSWHFNTEHPSLSFRDMYNHNHLCHVCGKGYSTIRALNEHKHVHTGAKPYACAECPATFHARANLRLHAERHRPRARECKHCGKKFVSASNLSNHMKQHTGLRPYKCQLCDKSFIHRNTLNEHVRGVHYHIRRTRKKAASCRDPAQEQEKSS